MTHTNFIMVPALVSVLALLGACSGSNSESFPANTTPPPTTAPQPSPTPQPMSGFNQKDRTAIPAVATLFIDPLGSRAQTNTDPKNAFNLGTPAQAGQFTTQIRTTLAVLRGLDDNPANDQGEAQDTTDPAIPRVSIDTAVAVIAPDVLRVNLDGSVAGLLTVELGVANAFGGRTLAEDVVDAALQVIVFPGSQGCTDNNPQTPCLTNDFTDANDVAFQANFPYVGLPHMAQP